MLRALLLCALALPSAAWGQTTCSAQQQFRLDWNTQTQGSQPTGTRTYTAADGLNHTETVSLTLFGDATTNRTVNFGGTIGTVQTPYVGVINTGGLAATEATLTLGATFSAYQTDIASNTNTIGARFNFSKPLREISFLVLDVDYLVNQFRDWIRVTGTTANGTVIVPRLESRGNTNNNQTAPGQTPPNTTAVGPFTFAGVTVAQSDVIGNASNTTANTGSSGNTSDLGNIAVSFAQPVVQVELRYANGPAAYNTGTPGQQAIGVHDLLFCTMPVVALAKSSGVVATAGPDRFATPGSEVDYTLTVTNNGGSPVDVNSTLIADVLPAQVTFFNGDIDPATPGVQTAVLTGPASGLTLAGGIVSYSNNAGQSYAYTPAAGYDPAVTAVRFQPQGQLAAYASATIRFRVRVK